MKHSHVKRGKRTFEEKKAKAQEEAVKAEEDALETQKASGGPIVKRIRGEPGTCRHDVAKRQLTFNTFVTVGVPELLITSGTAYYELCITRGRGVPQFGFALEEFEIQNCATGDGVGDDDKSWGLDGRRHCKWHKGNSTWNTSGWSDGDVLGLAVNVDLGKIAIAKNGSWTDTGGGCGVVFEDEKIKSGVYPSLTGGGLEISYNFDGKTHGPFKHGPPPSEVWSHNL